MFRMLRCGIALILCLALPCGLASAEPTAAERFRVGAVPRIRAGAAVLMDWRTGELLYARNPHQQRDPASTTKVLTALIALERGRLDDLVRVSRRAARTPGSAMHIKEGEVYSLYDLLHGLLLRSGNDAAVAIAEHLSGSVEEFARLMNQRAIELGAKHSHFVNPHGLTHPAHLSTAYDLAVITRAALRNPTFSAIVARPVVDLAYEELGREEVLYNTNRLLGWLEGADGVKTGTTAAAGPCLIASATREEQRLIAVVLHASDRWRESAELLEWGFRTFRVATFGHEGEVVRAVPLKRGKKDYVAAALAADLAVVLPRDSGVEPEVRVELTSPVKAPVAKGQRLGRAIVALEGGRPQQVDLVAAETVPRATWLDYIYRFLRSAISLTDDLGVNLIVPPPRASLRR